MSRIVFIVQQISQPRCIKRIETIVKCGYEYKIYGFKNGFYEENINGVSFEITKIIAIDRSKSKLYKYIKYFLYIKSILKEIDKNDVVYAFGFEIGLILMLFSKKMFIYEEADVFSARFSNRFIRWVFKLLDKKIIKKSLLAVITSEGFLDYLFNDKQSECNIVLMPNKLHPSLLSIERFLPDQKSIETIRFGFVGYIRYPNTIIRFAEVVGRCFPKHQYHFFGDGPDRQYAIDKLSHYNNVFFHGTFCSPQDLSSIYLQLDINVVCYDAKEENVRIAEPNKLYESAFFCRPIIVSKGTFLEKRVKELGVGFSLDASNDDEIVDFISHLTIHDISRCIDNARKISTEKLIDTPNQLLEVIGQIIPLNPKQI
jgi:glycosyltransferase involved in cell wall biosynthesis